MEKLINPRQFPHVIRFPAGTGRRSSAISRSSSFIDNTKSSYRKKKPCMWNLDFTPYNSPIIRIKYEQRLS